MRKILIKEFNIIGDLFYTDSIRVFCEKLRINSVSSFDEVDSHEKKVRELIYLNKSDFISSRVNKEELIDSYFTELRLQLRNS